MSRVTAHSVNQVIDKPSRRRRLEHGVAQDERMLIIQVFVVAFFISTALEIFQVRITARRRQALKNVVKNRASSSAAQTSR